jgi:hypothetical protein
LSPKLLAGFFVIILVGVGFGYVVFLDYSMVIQENNSLKHQNEILDNEYFKIANENSDLKIHISKLNDQFDDQISLLNDQISSLNDQCTRAISYLDLELTDLSIKYNELLEKLHVEVWNVTGMYYYNWIIEDFRRAEESIFVVMYSLVFNSSDTANYTNNLVEELVEAKKNGLNVTVFLEFKTAFGILSENIKVFEYLRDNNVTVILDTEPITDHMKCVIIDEKVVYLGSHNWNNSSLFDDNEISVKIHSEEIATKLRDYIMETKGF